MGELTITVNIADRPYRLKIQAEEEEFIRKASKLINEKIKEYSNLYAFNDRQDLLSMVVLHFATSTLNVEKEKGSNESLIIDKLVELNRKLADQLN